MENFEPKLQRFYDSVQKVVEAHRRKMFPTLRPDTWRLDRGSRLIKIVQVKQGDLSKASVWCFVDTANGNVLKPAGWKKPAPVARGNIFDDKNGMGRVTAYGPGPEYLRGR